MACVDPVKIPFTHPFLSQSFISVPCGKCAWCLERRQRQWAFRLHYEAKCSVSYFVLTLTYDNDNLPTYNGFPVLSKKDLQLFNKRLRVELAKQFSARLRFFAVGEYGSHSFRPHYHVLYFINTLVTYDDFLCLCLKQWTKCDRYVLMRGLEIPKRGMMYYVAQYCLKNLFTDYEFLPKEFRPFMLCSNRPAIGSCYLTPDMIKYHRDSDIHFCSLEDGVKVSMPRYYRNKIWSDEERQKQFCKVLIENGDLPYNALEPFIESYGDCPDAFHQMHNHYNDCVNAKLKNYRNKRKI